MPGSSPTMARREPTMRLKSVDLPTLGRPTMATVGMPAAVVASVLVELYVGWVKVESWSYVGKAGTRIIETLVALSSQPTSSTSPNRPAPGGKDASLYQFFGPGGVLSRTHPAYEFRRGQLQMAQAVEQALEEKRHLIVEAGTGTGKTLAYLVPAIRSGKRIIISTGTKTLQEQLFHKDIPFLEQALFPNGEGKLKVCYMKGRNK